MIWCKYPWHNEIEEQYCVFSYSKKKFIPIDNLRIDTNTSIKEKKDYLMQSLNIKKVKVIKL